MYLTEHFKPLKRFDIGPLLARLKCLNPEDWLADETLRVKLAGQRPTRSVFLYNLSEEELSQALLNGPLNQDQVSRCAGFEKLHDVVWPLVQQLIASYPSGGVVTRLQLALLPAGAEIEPHYDTGFLLRLCHRIHLPLMTHERVQFVLAGDKFFFEAGRGVEINNRIQHGVYNHSSVDRIHLLLDYLPPEHNHVEWLSRKEHFLYKTSLKPQSLPTVLVTSVVRGAQQNQSHGGLFEVNLERNKYHQILDWNTCDIDFQGRGWDRGLRGMALFGARLYVAASDELFCYKAGSEHCLGSWKNPYLKHAHEISIAGRYLFMTSTGFDSILRFDLLEQRFDKGWMIRINDNHKVSYRRYDPLGSKGPKFGNTLHLNNIYATTEGIYFSGKNFPQIMCLDNSGIKSVAKIPLGTHNAQPLKNGIIYNDTVADRVVLEVMGKKIRVAVPQFNPDKLENAHLNDGKLARPGFARGLEPLDGLKVLAGASPSTVSLIDFQQKKVVHSLNLTLDIRHAIHGLEIVNLN